MEYEPVTQPILPRQIMILAVLVVSAVLICLVFSATAVKGDSPPPAGQPTRQEPKAANPPASAHRGSAYLDLNKLTRANSIDESDNARWSLVRGTPAGENVLNGDGSVDWHALRKVSSSGEYEVKAGSSWSFNDTFGGGSGYKIASGVLAGGQCALATVFRGAAIQAGLPNHAKPHRYPIPGFPLSETVNIWWGRDDLVIRNTAEQTIYLAWELSPDGVTVSVRF